MNVFDHPVHAGAPHHLDFVAETPKGDTRKFKYDPDEQVFKPRPRYPFPIPFHYGFIPGTVLEADDSQLDAILLDDIHLDPGQEIQVSPLGLIERVDDDHKLLVACDPYAWTEEQVAAIRNTATELFNRDPTKRVTAVRGCEAAVALIAECIDTWHERYRVTVGA